MPTINGKACVANGRNLLTSANGEIGNISGKDGTPIGYSFTNYYRTKDFIEVLPSTHYFLKVNSPSDTFTTIEKVLLYDSDKTYISSTSYANTSTCAITSPKNAAFFKFVVCFEYNIPAGTNVWRDNKVKFEEGTIPTALTPAPVDKAFSNGRQVYGRNLVTGTGQDTVIDDTANTGTQGFKFYVFNLTQQPKVGDQITVSANGMLTGRGDLSTYGAFLYNYYIEFPRSNPTRLTAGERSSATLEVNSLDGAGDTVLLIYAGNIGDTEGKKNVIHHLKVEFGSAATPWTPAPEDVM